MPEATIVWVAPQPPDAGQDRTISAYGRGHGIILTAPPNPTPPTLAVDLHLAEAIGDLLDRARDAVTASDGGEADRKLESAQQILEAHAELPNAAWLMAEVERVRSTRLRRVPPTDDSAANRAWMRAEALDGGRIAGASEERAPESPRAATLLFAPPAGEEVWVDGHRAERGLLASQAGPHALVVTWNDAPIWASWIDVGPGTASVPLPPPASPPCSEADVGRVRVVHGEALPPGDLRCGHWVVATTGLLPGAVRFAACETAHCGDLLDFRSPPPAWTFTPAKPAANGRWPTWTTWGIAGAGVAALAGAAVAIAVGSQSSAGETRFVNGGLKSP